MKFILKILACLLFSLPARAQITFHTTDLPGRVEIDSWRAWMDVSGKDVSLLRGSAGGPHRWDFSYAKSAGETVLSTSIVEPNAENHGGSYAAAGYAERETDESKGCTTSSFFQKTSGAGRSAFGFYDACKAGPPEIVFSPPVIDLPGEAASGTSWHNATSWHDTYDAGIIVLDLTVDFVSDSVVDGYGTVVLPGIGESPALRVMEVNTYKTADLTLGISIPDQHFRIYYWLVPGIGKAVQIFSPPGESPPAENFPVADRVLRVFESSRFSLPELNISLTAAGTIGLHWDTSGFLLQRSADLVTWAPVSGSVSETAFTEPATAAPSFFRLVTP